MCPLPVGRSHLCRPVPLAPWRATGTTKSAIWRDLFWRPLSFVGVSFFLCFSFSGHPSYVQSSSTLREKNLGAFRRSRGHSCLSFPTTGIILGLSSLKSCIKCKARTQHDDQTARRFLSNVFCVVPSGHFYILRSITVNTCVLRY